jgi:Protein of unknown function (DUF3417)
MARIALKQRSREIWQKLSYLEASPDQIAAGFSIGIFASFLPLNPSPTILMHAKTMSEQTRVSHPIYKLLPTEIERFDSLAELALDMRWSWNHATDQVWRQLDPELWELGAMKSASSAWACLAARRARCGTSIMPEGPKEAYEQVCPLLEAVAAKVNGDPCVA